MHCILFQCLYWCLFSAWNVHVLIYHYDSRVLQIYMYYPLRHKKAILSITDCLNKIKSVSTDTSDRLYIWDYCIHQFDPCGLWLKWGYSQNFLRKLKGAVLCRIMVFRTFWSLYTCIISWNLLYLLYISCISLLSLEISYISWNVLCIISWNVKNCCETITLPIYFLCWSIVIISVWNDF